jgi:hypothetical protein
VPDDRELVGKAQAIVTGDVVAAHVRETADGFETVYTLRVASVLKGAVDATDLEVVSPGGSDGHRFTIVQGTAHFKTGEHVLLFLTKHRGNWTTTDWTLGKFRFLTSTGGQSLLVRDAEDIVGFDRQMRPHTEKIRREAEFLHFIQETVRGRQVASESYLVDAKDVVAIQEELAADRFRAISNVVYASATYASHLSDGVSFWPGRWPSTRMSASLARPFLKNSAQNASGLGDGGVAVITNALAAWTNDCASVVNITYGGTTALLKNPSDNINVVVWNDPGGNIPGSWTGSGVVATAFGQGDNFHTFDGRSDWVSLADEDVIVQNGITGAEAMIPVVMTHELGHAIGLRHANTHYDGTACQGTEECTGSAVMNSFAIPEYGNTLQSWDRTAVAALYPGGSCCTLPTVTAQPQPSSINPGGSTNVAVTVTGTGPFNYKWYTGVSGNTTNLISDGTSNTILVSPASTTTYWVRITNACGSVDSAAATVTVNACVAPGISSQPPNTTIWAGENAVVHVTATGSPTLTYQWYAGESGSTTSPLPGQTTSTLTWPQDRTFNFWVRVSNGCGTVNSSTFTITVRRRVPGDYNADGIIDPAVFRPSTGQFLIKEIGTFAWGTNGDKPVPGDYDGDNATDIATWTPSTGTWNIRLSSNGTTVTDVWGQAGDIPAQADNDGDRRTDLIVFRPSNGTWYIKYRTGATTTVVLGQNGDVPAPGDYDHNGIDELAVFRPSTGHWFIKQSSVVDIYWGAPGDVAVPADWDNDGDFDVAIFRPSDGYWHIRLPSFSAIWGVGTDLPVQGNYIAGTQTRCAVFRPTNGTWYIKNGTGFVWGQSGDIPLSR